MDPELKDSWQYERPVRIPERLRTDAERLDFYLRIISEGRDHLTFSDKLGWVWRSELGGHWNGPRRDDARPAIDARMDAEGL